LKYWLPPLTTTRSISLHLLREGLRMALEEGLETLRHRQKLLWEGLMVGFTATYSPILSPAFWPLHNCRLQSRCRTAPAPAGEYNIEIAGGFGPLAGKIWRIG
jgi:alanine-glyoxylate transaminase/serine-glyoxylate transaminase/serine-pyruvate transaminase